MGMLKKSKGKGVPNLDKQSVKYRAKSGMTTKKQDEAAAKKAKKR